MTDDGGPSQGSTVKKVCAVQCTISSFRRAQYSAQYRAEKKRNQAPDSNRNVKGEENLMGEEKKITKVDAAVFFLLMCPWLWFPAGHHVLQA